MMSDFDQWIQQIANRHSLIPYGIQNEKSDFRVHVCPVVKRIYVYPTPPIVEKLKNLNMVERLLYLSQPVSYGGGNSAIGLLIPYNLIPECKAYQLPGSVDFWEYITRAKNGTSDKGARTTRLVSIAISEGWIPFRGNVKEVTNIQEQILGIDLTAGKLTIQIKHDLNGGPKELGGTGNLFLQIAERNNTGEH